MKSTIGLPKQERLLKSAEFKRIFKEGKRVFSDGLLLYALPNNLRINRIGLSVPSSVFKHSSKRNKIKRLIKEAYRKNKHALVKGLDLVFIAKQTFLTFSYEKTQNQILYLVNKIGTLTAKNG